jgi:phosphatidate cytidylyltransferase
MKKNGIQVNEITEKTKKSLIKRIITALVLCLVCIPCLLLGNWFFFTLIFIVSIISIYEFMHVLHDKKHPLWIDIFTFIMTLSFIYWTMIKAYFTEGSYTYHTLFALNEIGVSTLALSGLICVLFLASMLTSKFSVSDVCYYIAMSLFISISIQSLVFLRYVPSFGLDNVTSGFDYNGNKIASCILLCYVIIGAFGADIGAYFIGVLFGKHKINPRISPNKTWEGLIGGFVFSFILSFTFAYVLSLFNYPLLLGVLDKSHWYWILLISLIMPIVSVLGDFIFSSIKRYYNIKDFSNILPGHGGVLDRIDSLLVTSLFVTIAILCIAYFPFIGV